MPVWNSHEQITNITQPLVWDSHKQITNHCLLAGLSVLLPVTNGRPTAAAGDAAPGTSVGLAAMPFHVSGHFLLSRAGGRRPAWQASLSSFRGRDIFLKCSLQNLLIVVSFHVGSQFLLSRAGGRRPASRAEHLCTVPATSVTSQ